PQGGGDHGVLVGGPVARRPPLQLGGGDVVDEHGAVAVGERPGEPADLGGAGAGQGAGRVGRVALDGDDGGPVGAHNPVEGGQPPVEAPGDAAAPGLAGDGGGGEGEEAPGGQRDAGLGDRQ